MERVDYIEQLSHLNAPVANEAVRVSRLPEVIPGLSKEAIELTKMTKAADVLMASAHNNSSFREIFKASRMRPDDFWNSLLDSPSRDEDSVGYVVALNPTRVFQGIRQIVDDEEAASIVRSAINTFEVPIESEQILAPLLREVTKKTVDSR